MSTAPHRKRVQHFHEPGDFHELTFSCYHRLPLLTNGTWCGWFCESLDRACERHRFGLLAYVIMPEHVHLMTAPLTNVVNIPRLLSDIERGVSLKVKRALIDCGSPLLARLTIRQRPGVSTFRFLQEGPGYDRNLREPDAILSAIDYIHQNPVRRNLCRRAIDWRWSSARRLILDQFEETEVPRLTKFDPDAMLLS
jgi:putative transposase